MPPIRFLLAGRRLFRVALVLGLVALTGLGGSAIASADGGVGLLTPPITSNPSPIRVPAMVLADIVGAVAPEAGAARAAGMALDVGANGAINTGAIGTTLNIASWLPGFKLGYKAGEWIGQGLGLYDPAPVLPAFDFTPYNGLVLTDPGFDNGDQTMTELFGSGPRVRTCTAGPYSAGFMAPAGTFINTPEMVCRGALVGGEQGYYNYAVYDTSGTFVTAGSQPGTDPNYMPDTMFVYAIGYRDPVSNDYRVPGWIVMCDGPVNMTGCAIGSPTVAMVYRFPGAVGRPPEPSATPSRLLMTTATCQLSGGATAASQYWTSPFLETSTAFPVPVDAVCPSGQLVGSSLDLVKGDSPFTVVSNLSSWSAPASYTDWLTANPSCWDAGCGGVQLEHLSGGVWTSCFVSAAGCSDWSFSPQKNETFRCTQNGVVLTLDQCNYYAPTFNPADLAAGRTYGDPATGAIVDPSMLPVNSPVRQPLGVTNAQAVASETRDPTATTSPSTTPSSTPATTPGVAPGQGGTPAGLPNGASADEAACYPSGWSMLNPVEWVLKPVKCALNWAFVPAPGAMDAEVATFTAAYQGSAAGQWLGALSATWTSLSGVGDGTACLGPRLDFPIPGGGGAVKTMYLASACDEPMKSIAALTHLIATLAAVIFGGLACWRGVMEVGFGLQTFHARAEEQSGSF